MKHIPNKRFREIYALAEGLDDKFATPETRELLHLLWFTMRNEGQNPIGPLRQRAMRDLASGETIDLRQDDAEPGLVLPDP